VSIAWLLVTFFSIMSHCNALFKILLKKVVTKAVINFSSFFNIGHKHSYKLFFIFPNRSQIWSQRSIISNKVSQKSGHKRKRSHIRSQIIWSNAVTKSVTTIVRLQNRSQLSLNFSLQKPSQDRSQILSGEKCGLKMWPLFRSQIPSQFVTELVTNSFSD